MKHKQSKLGGWLRVIQVGTILFTVILGISAVANIRLYLSTKDGLTLAATLSSAAIYLLVTIPVWQMLGRRPKFLRNYHIIVLLMLSLDCIKNFILRFEDFTQLFLETRSSSGSSALTILLFALSLLLVLLMNAALLVPLWLYFIRSRRLRSYMGTDRYFRTLLTKKMNCPAPLDEPPQPSNAASC